MGILDWLFGASDPTREWVRDPAFVLDLDLAANALCGVAIGDAPDPLAGLGRCEDAQAVRCGELRWPSRGLEVELRGGRVASYFVVFDPEAIGDPEFRAFEGRLRLGERALALDATTLEPAVRAALGEPYWRDDDPDETLLFYERGPVEWQVELGPGGRLAAIVVASPPILSYESQREAYGVTAPWPPEAPPGS